MAEQLPDGQSIQALHAQLPLPPATVQQLERIVERLRTLARDPNSLGAVWCTADRLVNSFNVPEPQRERMRVGVQQAVEYAMNLDHEGSNQ
jgi:hypothetical protein